jgi:hypothetical protein
VLDDDDNIPQLLIDSLIHKFPVQCALCFSESELIGLDFNRRLVQSLV